MITLHDEQSYTKHEWHYSVDIPVDFVRHHAEHVEQRTGKGRKGMKRRVKSEIRDG